MQSIEKILLEFDVESRNLLPVLKKTSATFGYINNDHASIIASFFSLPLSRVFEVASFYDLILVKKKPTLMIQICDSPNCGYRASISIIKSLERHLRIKEGDASNPKVRLEAISCLSHCKEGPIMIINGETFMNVNSHLAIDLVNKFL